MAELLAGTIRTATPILLAALGGLLCERIGIFNIALEGLLLLGAFFGIFGMFLTGNLFVAVVFAVVVTVLFSTVFAWFIEKLDADPTITALGLNMLAEGITTFLMKYVFGDQGSVNAKGIVGMPKIRIPLIADIPFLGKVISGHTILVYVSWILVGLCAFLLFKTMLGVNMRMVGENRRAAEAAGIKTAQYRILTVAASGIFCALGGAYLSLGYVTMFTENMTAGRGFIAYTAVVFGKASPGRVLVASLVFGFAEALSYRVQQFGNLPSPIVMMMPYLITIIALLVRTEQFRKINCSKTNKLQKAK